MEIIYKPLTIFDIAKVLKYLKSDYDNVSTIILRTILNKSISIGAFTDNDIVGCYLLDIDLYGVKGPEVVLKYVKVDNDGILRPLLSAVSIFHSFNIELSPEVQEYLKVVSTESLLKKYYLIELFSVANAIDTINKKIISRCRRDLQLEFYSVEDKEDLLQLIREYNLERNSAVFVDEDSSLDSVSSLLDIKEGEILEGMILLRCLRYNKIVGYAKYTIIDEYGTVPPYLYGEYTYITPSYRKGMAATILYGFLCYLSSKLGMYIKWDVYTDTNSEKIAANFLKAEKYMEGFKLTADKTSKFAESMYLRNIINNESVSV